MPRFDDVDPGGAPEAEFVEVDQPTRTRRRTRRARATPSNPVVGLPQSLLAQEAVAMTVFAQDPIVVDPGGPILARIAVPADRLQRGPRSHRFHVVDVAVGTNRAFAPAVLHDGDPWRYVDRWAAATPAARERLVEDREFRAQMVFAVAAHTLALFERHLGRPIPWYSGFPQLYLVPQARLEANAFYSREHNAVLFGWLPATAAQPPLFTALSFDVVAHEVSHAILDGLRPRYTEPGLPDQLAFHEALADLVAMFAVFDLDGVAEHLLDPQGSGWVRFPDAAHAGPVAEPGAIARRRRVRAEHLKASPLTQLAEQLGSRLARPGVAAPGPASRRMPGGPYPGLRRSVLLPADTTWKTDPEYSEPHRRAEVLVAAFMQTFVSMWAGRLEPLRVVDGGMDASRVAEEGTKAAGHLLGMLLRALDYLPPVELEFADVLDSVITADRRLAPDDGHHYRDALMAAFAQFGITAPAHRIVDEDGVAAPSAEPNGAALGEPAIAAYPADPDATADVGLRYEHLNVVALRTSPEEVYQFIWSNAAILKIDVRFTTRVERVLASTRVGPDGLIVNEIIADYVQILRTTAGRLPPGIAKPAGMVDDTPVELWGGGVLVFDQFGRFRLHQRQPLLDVDRQTRRLAHLFTRGLSDRGGGFGASDGVGDKRRFNLLHRDALEAAR